MMKIGPNVVIGANVAVNGNSMNYPTIEKAVVEMAYDNGCIHRNQTEEKLKARVMGYILGKFTKEVLDMVEDHLKDLNEEDFTELTCGETDKIVVHEDVREVLNEVFEAL